MRENFVNIGCIIFTVNFRRISSSVLINATDPHFDVLEESKSITLIPYARFKLFILALEIRKNATQKIRAILLTKS